MRRKKNDLIVCLLSFRMGEEQEAEVDAGRNDTVDPVNDQGKRKKKTIQERVITRIRRY